MVVVLHCVTGVTGPSGSNPPLPPPPKIFSSDLGESHGLVELGLGARAPRAPRGYATDAFSRPSLSMV